MSNTCQICGQPLSAEAVDGFCVACLFGKGAAARCRPAFTPPAPRLERLGDHELLGELGRGAMGRVYRARQVRPDRVVALKVISAWAIGFANHLERFRVEAQAAAKLGHPNIVPIYEVGEEAEWHYFSMRLIEGGSLSCALTKGRLPFEKTARLLATVARAIQHAHERGVLHRDIKPGNILLDASGEPHVADFGLAKITESDSNLTLTRTALGTPAYMAPEQAAGRGKEITTAVDVYGLGAVLFEMLTARAPFVGDSPMAVARQVVEEEAPAPISLDSTIPVELSVICSKCLEKAPSRRYSSAGTLADDLERWLRHEPILAQSTTALGRLGKWARRKPVHAALVGTVALGCLALIAGLFWHYRRISVAQHATEFANRELARQLRRVEWRQAEDALANGRTPDALSIFARFVRETPDDLIAAARLRSLLEMRAFPLPAAPALQHERPVRLACMDPLSRRVWTIADDGVLRAWNDSSGALENQAALELASDALQRLPDGRLLLHKRSGTVLLWNSEKWKPDHELASPAAFDRKWEVSDDGRWIALTGPDQAVELWDTTTGKLVAQTKTAARLPELAASLGPTGETIIRGHNYGAWLWRPHQASPVALLDPNEEIVCTVADWPRQRLYVSVENPGGNTHGVICLSLEDGRELARNMAPLAWHTIEPSPDGAQLAVSRWGVGATVIDASTLRERFAPIGAAVPVIPRISPDRLFHVGFQALHDGSGRLHDLVNGQVLMEPVQHMGTILKHQLSPDGARLLTASQDGTARLWDVRMRAAETLLIQGPYQVIDLALSPDARRLAAAIDDQIFFYDAATGRALLKPVAATDGVNDVAFSPDGRSLAAACSDKSVRLIDPQTGQILWRNTAHPGRVWLAVFSPDGTALASSSEDGSVQLLETASGRALFPALQHSDSVEDVSFSPDGRLLASASDDSTARIWDARTGKPLSPVLRHKGSVCSARFSPDSRRLVTASYDRTAQLWAADTGAPIGTPIRAETGLMGAVFSADGGRILIYTFTGARIYDAQTLKPLTPPMLHGDSVHRVKTAAFSPDGRWVATGSEDGAARVWDAQTGYPITEPLRHQRGVTTLLWLPNSRQLLTGSFDTSIRRWDLPDLGTAPPWLPDLAEALAGKRDEPNGGSTPVPSDQLGRIRRDAMIHDTGDDRWLHWFFSGRLEARTPTRAAGE